MSAPDAIQPVGAGTVLCSRYRLVRLIAQGGMASVWEAHDNVLARSVAVKTLHPHLAQDRLFLERFRQEAISAARLAHPNVVATYDAGITPDGIAFIVMELIRGRTLSAFAVEHRPLPIFVSMEIGRQIADALAHAHASGLIHRDIKPANVLVCDIESHGMPLVKVTDFGIAKAVEGLGMDLTKTGMILGTPKYLSPEQIDGRDPDPRADLYSLGVVMFELVAGTPPFRGPTEMAVAVQHLHDVPPRLRDVRPGVPPALDALVAAMLSKRPGDRPPSAVAVRQALAAMDPGDRQARAPSGPLRSGGQQPGLLDAGGRPVHAPAVPPGYTSAASSATAVGPAPLRTSAGIRGMLPPPPRAVPTGSTAPRGPAPAVGGASRLERRPATPKRSNWAGWVVAALVVAALAVVLLVVASHGSGASHNPSGVATSPSVTPITIEHASVFHLERDADNAATVGYTIDRNPDTSWETDTYFGPNFAGLRHGLGVAVTLDAPHSLKRLTVTSSTVGWSAEVFVADAVPNPPSLAPWGAPVDSQQNIKGSTTFDLHGQRGSAILLWLTDLGPTYQASIAEISAS